MERCGLTGTPSEEGTSDKLEHGEEGRVNLGVVDHGPERLHSSRAPALR